LVFGGHYGEKPVRPFQVAVLKAAGTGGAAFWLPSVLLHALIACDNDWAVPSLSTLILPLTTCTAFVILTMMKRVPLPPVGIALSMLAGVWLLGSGAMTISGTFCEGGFRQGVGVALTSFVLGLLPPYAFIMATYDGALFGLILINGLLAVAWVPFEIAASVRRKRRPSVPPNDAADEPRLGLGLAADLSVGRTGARVEHEEQ